MPQTTACPRCRQPVLAEIEQLFDLAVDPRAKQRLLSGITNVVQCPNCGYQGAVSTPIVYHDPEKQLLLTYFPPELGVSANEQERLIGPLINQVINRLPPEKRMAYLLNPQPMFTFDSLIQRILEADGITKEMLQAQQDRLNLLQRLLSISAADTRKEIIHQEEKLIDAEFFTLLGRLVEISLAQGDQNSARALANLQKELMTETEFGRQLSIQVKETEAAVKSLQEASKKGLTREMLLDLMIEAPSETRLTTLVNMTHSALDYSFFQILTDRIEKAQADQRQKLVELREKLLAQTREINQAIKAQKEKAHQELEKILEAPDLEKALEAKIPEIDEYFMQALENEIENARQDVNLEKMGKLQRVADALKKYSTPPPEIALVEELISVQSDQELEQVLKKNVEQITPEFLALLASLASQSDQNQPKEIQEKLQQIYRKVLRFSMQQNLRK